MGVISIPDDTENLFGVNISAPILMLVKAQDGIRILDMESGEQLGFAEGMIFGDVIQKFQAAMFTQFFDELEKPQVKTQLTRCVNPQESDVSKLAFDHNAERIDNNAVQLIWQGY